MAGKFRISKKCIASDLAELLGESPRNMRFFASKGMPRDESNLYLVRPSIIWYISHLKQQAKRKPDKPDKPDKKTDLQMLKIESEIRLNKARADKEEISSKQIKKELINYQQTQSAVREIIGTLKKSMLSLSTSVSSELVVEENPAVIKRILDDKVREIFSNAKNELEKIARLDNV